MIVASGIAALDEAQRIAMLWAAGSERRYAVFRHRVSSTFAVSAKDQCLSEGERQFLDRCHQVWETDEGPVLRT